MVTTLFITQIRLCSSTHLLHPHFESDRLTGVRGPRVRRGCHLACFADFQGVKNDGSKESKQKRKEDANKPERKQKLMENLEKAKEKRLLKEKIKKLLTENDVF